MVAKSIKDSKFPIAYWSEYSQPIISNLELKKTSQGEFHGPCPNCSGVDRFWIKEFNGEVLVNCRKCQDYKAIKDKLKDMSLWPTQSSAPPVRKEVRTESQVDWPESNDMSKHPYLEKKKLSLHNAKIEGDKLVISIIDVTGKRVGYQYIDAEGKKKFSYNMPVVGHFSVIGGPIKDFAYITEGWANAATIHEATDKPTIFALSANNIPSVVDAISQSKPKCELVVAGDNDEAGRKACETTFEQHGVEYILPEQEGWDFSDLWVIQGREATRKALTVANVMDQIFMPEDAVPQLSRNYLIKRWLTEGGMSVIYGQSNVGKSFFALDMGCHVGGDNDWNGSKVNGGSVLYLATEGGMAFHNRVVALRQHYPNQNNVKLAVRPSPVNLLDPDVDMASLVKLCAEISKRHGPLKMIVVDTLSRAMAGGNENAPEAMTSVISNCDKLRIITKAHVSIVHHSGKDKAAGARGHSSLRAATDSEIELEHDEVTGLRTAKSTKQRDMETGTVFTFKLKVVELGIDEDGDAVTTCVIHEASESEIAEASKPKIKGKNQLIMRNAFTQLRGEGVGQPNHAGAGFPEPRTYWMIQEEDLRNHFLGKVSNASNPRSSYKQAIDALISAGHLVQNDGFVWFLDGEGKC